MVVVIADPLKRGLDHPLHVMLALQKGANRAEAQNE